MRLFEHRDFQQAILQAAEHFRSRRLRPAIIEKDYYVTEALRIIAAVAREQVIFKGGTSLAKGWNLIGRPLNWPLTVPRRARATDSLGRYAHALGRLTRRAVPGAARSTPTPFERLCELVLRRN
jgi:hypothetical protein